MSKAKASLLPPKTLAADAAAAEALSRRIGVDPNRAESYRTGYRRLLWLVYVLTFAILGLIALLVFVIITRAPQDRYFAQTSEGATMRLVGLDRPNMNEQTMFDWAAEATSQILTFGFNDYNAKLNAVHNRFTEDGWASFAPTLYKSKFFQGVISEQQIVTSVPKAPPRLFSEGLVAGQYSWIIEIPMLLTVRSGSISRTLDQTVRIVIVRVPTDLNPSGIAIDRWISF